MSNLYPRWNKNGGVNMSENTVTKEKRRFTTRQITITGMLSAISIVLGITGLGFTPIPPFGTTIMHVPVIIGSLLEGPVVGGVLGLIFGLTSIFQAIKTPTPVSFIFMDPLVAVLPRVLIGVMPYLVYKALKSVKKDSIKLIFSIAAGSFTNTIGVLAVIYVLYFDKFVKAYQVTVAQANKIFIGLLLNGFISAGFAIIVALPVVKAIKVSRK